MTPPSEMLVYGQFQKSEQASMKEAARSAAIALHRVASPGEASQWLEGHEAVGLLLAQEQTSEALALGARTQSGRRQLPILALSRDPSDLSFADAYSWGADDVVPPGASHALARRLRAVVQARGEKSPAPRGIAIVGEVDQFRRVATARALVYAGYEVRFALTEEDARTFSLDRDSVLVVLCTELCRSPESLVSEALHRGSKAKFVISSEPRRYNQLCRQFSTSPSVRITDSSSPPGNVVFLANELASSTRDNQRSTPRILHGTTVRFRGQGHDEDEIGFTYNVSEGGLYIRTLAPPMDNIVWLELTPPKASMRVRLVGEVVWRQAFGPPGQATVPPGFGVKLVDGAKRCVMNWRKGCATAHQEVFAPASS